MIFAAQPRRALGLIAFAITCLTLISGRFPVLSADQRQKLDDAIRSEMKRQQVVGLAIAIIRDGQIDYIQGYGHADRERNVPVDPKVSMFRWASISKPVTAIAAMQLQSRGQLDLDADARTYVPEFPEKSAPITLRQLLSHQGGIVHYANGKIIVTPTAGDADHPFQSVITALNTFKESPLIAPPGERFSYSTHGYILASAVVERAGKQPFWDQTRERVAKPSGMSSFQPDYQWVAIPNRVKGYRKRGQNIVPSTDTDVSWKLGGGGFISTVEDLARFGIALIDGKLVPKDARDQMWTPRKTQRGIATGYGLGFHIDRRADGGLRISHNGGQEKTAARLLIVPGERFGVAIMCNTENAQVGRFAEIIETALGR